MLHISKRPWISQPPFVAKINFANPSSRGLIAAYMGSARLINLTGYSPALTAVNDPTIERSGQGIGFKCSVNKYYAINGLHGAIAATNEVTLLMVMANGTTENQGLMRLGVSGDIDHYPYDGTIYSDAFATSRWVSSAPAVPFTTPHVLTIRYKSGAQTFKQNCITVASGSSSSNPTANTQLRIGASENAVFFYSGDIPLVLIWNRYLSDSEELLLARTVAHPWQLFTPLQRADLNIGAASGLPILSAPTYVPGSLTSSGWIPQVTAT
jgi:hypothetical protein